MAENSDRPIRLTAISHPFTQAHTHARWRRLAEEYPVDVTLIAPESWSSDGMKERFDHRMEEIDEGRFHVRVIPTGLSKRHGWYLFKSLDLGLLKTKPDVIYAIQSEGPLVFQQIITAKNLFARRARLIFFTMNALGVDQSNRLARFKWRRVKSNTEAALCHYPGCSQSLREGGYGSPIYIQTQIGVNERTFYPSESERLSVRNELDLGDYFVVGYAGRVIRDKGIMDLADVLRHWRFNWKLLLVGDGDCLEEVIDKSEREGWQDRLVTTGAVPQDDVGRYMRAMDCFVHYWKRADWLDTFPLGVAQAMATGLPVVGVNHGSIPWQLDGHGLLFEQGDTATMFEQIRRLGDRKELRKELGARAMKRSLSRFSVGAINRDLYDVLRQVTTGNYADPLGLSEDARPRLL